MLVVLAGCGKGGDGVDASVLGGGGSRQSIRRACPVHASDAT